MNNQDYWYLEGHSFSPDKYYPLEEYGHPSTREQALECARHHLGSLGQKSDWTFIVHYPTGRRDRILMRPAEEE